MDLSPEFYSWLQNCPPTRPSDSITMTITTREGEAAFTTSSDKNNYRDRCEKPFGYAGDDQSNEVDQSVSPAEPKDERNEEEQERYEGPNRSQDEDKSSYLL